MKKPIFNPLYIFLILFGFLYGNSDNRLAIVGATIIDGTGKKPIVNGVILIENGRIKAVGKKNDIRIPMDFVHIQAKGKFLIPGLMDANLHLFLNIDLETLIKYEDRYHEIVIEAAQIALKTGQTTVFDTWGPRAALVKARDMINDGEVPGSRIYLAGNIIGFGGPLSADFRAQAAPYVSKAFVKRIEDAWVENTGRSLLWMTPDEVRSIIRDYTTKSMDFLKYGASGHKDMNFISFSERVQRVIVEEGHRAGMTVQTHTTSVESLDMAIEAGVDIVTHGGISGPTTPIPDETIQKLVDRDVAISALAITQKRLDALIEHAPGSTLTPYMKIQKTNHENMIKAGVILLVSTDAGIQNPVLTAESDNPSVLIDPRTKLGDGHFNALLAFEERGMKPMEILKSATSHVARAYELEDEIGTLESGKIADMVLLNANPLKSAKNYRKINMVIKEGKVVDLDALPIAPIISSMEVAPTETDEKR